MIQIILIFFCLSMSCTAMDRFLTPQEKKCFDWTEKFSSEQSKAYTMLDSKNAQNLHQSTNQDEVLIALNAFVEKFYIVLEDKKIKLVYNKSFIKDVFRKVKLEFRNNSNIQPLDQATAKVFVFSKKLTPEEQKCFFREGYFLDKNKTESAVARWANLLTLEYVKLGLVANQNAEKKRVELYNECLKKFQEMYE